MDHFTDPITYPHTHTHTRNRHFLQICDPPLWKYMSATSMCSSQKYAPDRMKQNAKQPYPPKRRKIHMVGLFTSQIEVPPPPETTVLQAYLCICIRGGGLTLPTCCPQVSLLPSGDPAVRGWGTLPRVPGDISDAATLPRDFIFKTCVYMCVLRRSARVRFLSWPHSMFLLVHWLIAGKFFAHWTSFFGLLFVPPLVDGLLA